MTRRTQLYYIGKEVVLASSHVLGIILSITVLVFLVFYSVKHGNGHHIVLSDIYPTSLIIFYSDTTMQSSTSLSWMVQLLIIHLLWLLLCIPRSSIKKNDHWHNSPA